MGTFRFIHTADHHIGYSGNASRYNEYASLRIDKKADNGLNIRTDDVNKAFEKMITIAIEEKVDAVISSGDLFDAWGYKQPIIYDFVHEQLLRLTHAKIPFVTVIGNHDLPKTEGKGTYLKSLSRLDGVYAAHRGVYEKVSLPNHEDVLIHLVPSSFNQEMLNDQLDAVEREEGKVNIGVGHFGVTSIDHYAENAENSLVFSLDQLINKKLDYWALGDFHKPTDFGYNIHYSGSTDRMGFGEIDNDPIVKIVEIDKKTKNCSIEDRKIPVRDMIEIPSYDAKHKGFEQVNEDIQTILSNHDLKDKIVRFRVKNLSNEQKRLINDESIRSLTEDALYFKFERIDKTKLSEHLRSHGTSFEGVLEGWSSYVKLLNEDDQSIDKKRLDNEGHERLADAIDESQTSL